VTDLCRYIKFQRSCYKSQLDNRILDSDVNLNIFSHRQKFLVEMEVILQKKQQSDFATPATHLDPSLGTLNGQSIIARRGQAGHDSAENLHVSAQSQPPHSADFRALPNLIGSPPRSWRRRDCLDATTCPRQMVEHGASRSS
jgi:hypothetical protein